MSDLTCPSNYHYWFENLCISKSSQWIVPVTVSISLEQILEILVSYQFYKKSYQKERSIVVFNPLVPNETTYPLLSVMCLRVMRLSLIGFIAVRLLNLVRSLSFENYGHWYYSDLLDQDFSDILKNENAYGLKFCKPSTIGAVVFYAENTISGISMLFFLIQLFLIIFEWCSMIFIIIT